MAIAVIKIVRENGEVYFQKEMSIVTDNINEAKVYRGMETTIIKDNCKLFDGDVVEIQEVRRVKKELEVIVPPVVSPIVEEEDVSMSTHLKKYSEGYQKVKLGVGKILINNGDELAVLLMNLSPDQVLKVASQVLDNVSILGRYVGLNPGQRRMNSGNLIRNALKRGDIVIDDVKNVVDPLLV